MKSRIRNVRHLSAILYLLAASLALGSWSSWATGALKGKALEPGIKHFGKSYNELAGDWWNWAVQFPLATNPIAEDGVVDCTRGQTGKIWFLAGNFGGDAGEPNPSNRTCTIPSGKALFFPLANSLFWVPEDGANVDAVRKAANGQINPISELEVSIDGIAIADPFAYRAQSPPGGFALHFGPLLGDFGFGPLPDPRDPAVADGYWILLAPLRKGEHEIHFRSSDPAAGFNVEVTYHLTVVEEEESDD
jgi:hypothetical protein